LDALPTAWEVDTVFLARGANDRVVVTESAPARAATSRGAAPAPTERAPYRQRLGEHLDLAFLVPTIAPAAPTTGNEDTTGRIRSFALAVRGHYELEPGNGYGVDWGLLARRTGPGNGAFARYLRGDRSEPHWSLCPKRMLRDLFSDNREGAEAGATIACGGPDQEAPERRLEVGR
jgi:hypothetical protein